MEQETVLREILNAFKLHSEHIDKKLDHFKTELENKIDHVKTELEEKIDRVKTESEEKIDFVKTELETRIDSFEHNMHEGFARVDQRFDQLEKKVSGMRTELTETQENVHYLLSKNVQHEKKLHQLTKQPV